LSDVIEARPGVIDGRGQLVVDARELHAFLLVGKVFAAWVQDRIDQCQFVENQDFEKYAEISAKPGRPPIEYRLTLVMAKELCMLSPSARGHEARKYFIECERIYAGAMSHAAAPVDVLPATESSAVSPFNFEGKDVRVIVLDGVEWFVARDVPEGMGFAWKGSANIDHGPHEWKTVCSVHTPSGTKPTLALTEAGLNFFLSRSDKECARPLQMWIAGEVLPSIRKTGRYEAPRHPAITIVSGPPRS
jgi:phage anti-repressor protein